MFSNSAQHEKTSTRPYQAEFSEKTLKAMEINNHPSPFVLVKTGSGIFSPAVPRAGLKIALPHQYKRLSSSRKERVILDDYIFPVPLSSTQHELRIMHRISSTTRK